MNKVHLRVFALRYFAKDTMFLFCHYNAMGCRVFTGQKMFREKFIKVRDHNFILCQGIGNWKENQKLKHCSNLKDYFLNKVNVLKTYQS